MQEELKIDKMFKIGEKCAKSRNFMLKYEKKGGHWVWTVGKKGVTGYKICIKKGIY